MNDQKYKFHLYIANQHDKSYKLAEDLVAVLEQYYPGQYTVDVVDVLDNVEKALQNDIFATPTLIREAPEPHGRIIGDLSNMNNVLLKLGIL